MDEAGNIQNIAVHDRPYLVLDHGQNVLEEHLSKYGFASLEDAVAYYETPIFLNFNHVPSHVPVEILMVAEKPILAEAVVRILSNNVYKWCPDPKGDRRKGVYSFNYKVDGRHANVWMVSTFGHLKEQSFERKLNESENEVALYAKIEDSASSGSIPNHFFAKLAEGCHAVVLWLDNDHEGESISFEVIDYLFHYIHPPRGSHPMDVFFRARFSSPSEAVAAMKNLDRPNFLRYMAMMAKHHLDLRVGVSFSKCQKFAAKNILETYIRKLSFGPCSTVCVAIIVDHIAQKTPDKFCLEYTIDVDGEKLCIRSDPMDEKEAKERLESLQNVDRCEILEGPKYVASAVKKSPPGLNTFELMRDQSQFFKRSPENTAILVQDLYEMGLITYPRSESTKYPADLKLLRHLMVSSKLGLSKDMRFNVHKALKYGIDKGDHPPIMPTDKPLSRANRNRLSYDHLEVYYYICRRFLASFMDDYEYSRQSVTFDIGGHKLRYECLQHVKLGFTRILPEYKAAAVSYELSVKLIPGLKFEFHVSVKEYPPLLKEYELIQKMEKYNVGTDGTLPNYFSVIKNFGYVTLNPETRELKPSTMAATLIEAYQNCIPEMITPQYRAKFIEGIEEIATGQMDFVTFYNAVLKKFNGHYQDFKEFMRKYIQSEKEKFEESLKGHNDKQMARDLADKQAADERNKKFKVVPKEEFRK